MTDDPHADYFAAATPAAREALQAIQQEIERRVPTATRCIGYKMPAFRGKKIFCYFAAFKKHIGIYPPVTRDAALIAELTPYRNEKGNLAFPLGKPLPLDLIGRVAAALASEYA